MVLAALTPQPDPGRRSGDLTRPSPSSAIIRLVKLVNWIPTFQHPTEKQGCYCNPPYFHLGTSASRRFLLDVNARTLESLP
jgi:hypothetical protein